MAPSDTVFFFGRHKLLSNMDEVHFIGDGSDVDDVLEKKIPGMWGALYTRRDLRLHLCPEAYIQLFKAVQIGRRGPTRFWQQKLNLWYHVRSNKAEWRRSASIYVCPPTKKSTGQARLRICKVHTD